ncbi:hypothetical protein B0H11DRAFT_898521 [Mycena galericulata]|nr:hypothetical protein B0H11DRAFT_898521 [Mycena galericulata]
MIPWRPLPRATQEPYSAFPSRRLSRRACPSISHSPRSPSLCTSPRPSPRLPPPETPAAAAATTRRALPHQALHLLPLLRHAPWRLPRVRRSPWAFLLHALLRRVHHLRVLVLQCENASSAAPHRLHLVQASQGGRRARGRERRVGVRAKRRQVGGAGGHDVSRLLAQAVRGVPGRRSAEGESRRRRVRENKACQGHGGGDGEDKDEEFAFHVYDLSLENVFVDGDDPIVFTCVVNWESATTRLLSFARPSPRRPAPIAGAPRQILPAPL